MSKVAVFAFIHVGDDPHADTRVPRKGTRDAIKRLRGTLIEASMEEVDESELDVNGFYPNKH